MSKKANLPNITSAKSPRRRKAADKRTAKVLVNKKLARSSMGSELLRIAKDDSKVIFGARVSPNKSMKKLAEEVVPPLKRSLDEAKERSEDVDVFVVKLDTQGRPRQSAIQVTEVKVVPGSERHRGFGRRSTNPMRLSTDTLAERLLPDSPVPSPAQALQAQRESEARWSLLQEFGAYTSEQIADNRSSAKNRHALANRWRSEGKVFAVELRGQRLYPGFQFDPETFAPLPLVSRVLATLPRDEMSDWEVALWWVASNDWLAGNRPVDTMHDDPEAVSEAAARLAEPSPL